MIIRYSKIALVVSVAIYSTLVVFNNLTDYNSNFQLVSHVLQMDTTFPDNAGMWRAIEAPALHHAAYVSIILLEAAVAILCWLGAYRLIRAINGPKFNEAKGTAIAGLTLGIVLWFVGFMTVGGEWFLMWQSDVWNGQQAAFRLVAFLGIVLIYLSMPNDGTAK